MKEGARVKIHSYPALFPWMEEYVGRVGTVSVLGERAVCVAFEDGDLWIAKSFVGPAETEEGAA